jgi:hypothetical protein
MSFSNFSARRDAATTLSRAIPEGVAQRTVVTLTDDLDGGQASETVSFSLDGKSYEIDLSAENSERLRSALRPYVEVARRAGRPPVTRIRIPAARDSHAIRSWALSNGYSINSRGRIPRPIVDAYQKAMS